MTKETPVRELLNRLDRDLVNLDDIPVMGHAPVFPWDEVATTIKQTFELDEFSIQPSDFQWRTKDTLFDKLGADLEPLEIKIPPHNGSLFWVMSKQDIDYFISFLMTKQKEPSLIDPDFHKGFYPFVGLEILHAISISKFDNLLSYQLKGEASLPKGAMLTLDVSVSVGNHTMWARLFISPELRSTLKEHYTKKPKSDPLKSEQAQNIEVLVHLEVGKTELSLDEWKKVKLGDFIFLDSITLDPTTKQGRVTLTAEGLPLFKGELEAGNIKITNNSPHSEGETE